jgi:hypothetical protein
VTGTPGWDAPWVVPAAVAVLAAVVLAITGCLILRHGRHEVTAGEAPAGHWLNAPPDSEEFQRGFWGEHYGQPGEPGELPPERSPEELGFRTERFATDTDVRTIGPAMAAGAASHYPGLYSHPPQVPRIAPDVPEQCWCGYGPRGHLPAYVSEVLSG